jgi:hypothetical protein
MRTRNCFGSRAPFRFSPIIWLWRAGAGDGKAARGTRLAGAFLVVGLALGCANPLPAANSSFFRVTPSREMVVVEDHNGEAMAVYHLRPPSGVEMPVESGGFFHPFSTPQGIMITDLAPADHRHHRGIFFGWVEMRGPKPADFWGWGEHAPVKERRIINRRINRNERGRPAGFQALNDWLAEDTVLLREQLTATITTEGDANILDLVYELTPAADLTLAQWAFSGFCLRLRKDGETEYHSPEGLVDLPNPSHLKPESNWPDQPWYAAQLKLPDGREIGGAVLNHPANPPTLWHNHRDVRMINPCIVAPQAIQLKEGIPLVLRYRIVAFDGSAPLELLNRLAKPW